MPGRITGATSSSWKRFFIDSGAIYFNYGEPNEQKIGATQEGTTFTLEQELRMPEIDGHRAPVLNTRRVISETARISGGILEMTSANLYRILTGSEVTNEEGYNITKRISDLPNLDQYIQNVALVGRNQADGDPYIFVLFNGLNDGGFEMETSDENEATLGVQFTGHTPIDDPDSSPFEIRTPEAIDIENVT